MSYKTHLFVCTNSPDNPEKCGSRKAESLRRELKEKCAKAFGKDVRINASGCLGHCERGIAAVLYPKGEWFFELSSADADRLFHVVEKDLNEKR